MSDPGSLEPGREAAAEFWVCRCVAAATLSRAQPERSLPYPRPGRRLPLRTLNGAWAGSNSPMPWRTFTIGFRQRNRRACVSLRRNFRRRACLRISAPDADCRRAGHAQQLLVVGAGSSEAKEGVVRLIVAKPDHAVLRGFHAVAPAIEIPCGACAGGRRKEAIFVMRQPKRPLRELCAETTANGRVPALADRISRLVRRAAVFSSKRWSGLVVQSD